MTETTQAFSSRFSDPVADRHHESMFDSIRKIQPLTRARWGSSVADLCPIGSFWVAHISARTVERQRRSVNG